MGSVKLAEATCIGDACVIGELSSWPAVEMEHENGSVSVAIGGSCASYKRGMCCLRQLCLPFVICLNRDTAEASPPTKFEPARIRTSL